MTHIPKNCLSVWLPYNLNKALEKFKIIYLNNCKINFKLQNKTNPY